uniref:Uncharacterized protein n=1 Tax=Rhizophora mucronata TaxID=61149 RepID=A0A2P2NR68_RHIMU
MFLFYSDSYILNVGLRLSSDLQWIGN